MNKKQELRNKEDIAFYLRMIAQIVFILMMLSVRGGSFSIATFILLLNISSFIVGNFLKEYDLSIILSIVSVLFSLIYLITSTGVLSQ